MAEINKISKAEDLPEKEEFFDAVRRHVCQTLGFDFGFIEAVNGHEIVTLATFSIEENDAEVRKIVISLHDEHNQSLALANTHSAQKAKQTGQILVSRAFDKHVSNQPATAEKEGYPYVIVPVVEGQPAPHVHVKGLIRIISFDSLLEVSKKDLLAFQLMAGHLSSLVPEFNQQKDTVSAKSAMVTDGSNAQADEPSNILIAHSNRPMRRRFSRILSSHYQVLEADSPDKTLETLTKNNVDLIILDNEIQGTSSFTFCKVLKDSSEWKDIPIILVSPDATSNTRVESLNVGAEDCLSESCFDPELLARVRSALRYQKAERKIAEQSQLLEAYDRRSEKEAARLSVEQSTEQQNQLKRNKQLEELRWVSEVLRTQDNLLHRISNTIRRSFDIKENLTEMLEDLSGWFNLETCFVVLPSHDNPDDSIRCEYVADTTYSAKEFDIDLKTYEIFQKHHNSDQCLIVNDVANEALLEPFRQETLTRQHVISLFYIPISYEEKLLGLLVGFKCESEAEWNSDNEVFLKSVADQVATGVVNARLYARVQRQATTDGLTGLMNHRTGQEKLAEQVRLAERYQRNIAVIMIDVDHFKAINDTYGHPAGDTVLKAVAKSIERDCRDVDFPVRYGGEEFLLVLPEINLEGAVTVAERIRKNLEQEVIDHENISISVTASMGVAIFPDDARSKQQLLDLADKALYASKRHGRNQVQTASDLIYDEIASKDQAKDKVKTPAPMPEKVKSSPATLRKEVEEPLSPADASAFAATDHPAPASETGISSAVTTPSWQYGTDYVHGIAPESASTSATTPPLSSTSSPEFASDTAPSYADASPSAFSTPLPAPQPTQPPASSPAQEQYSETGDDKDELVPEVVEMVKALATTLYSQSEYNKIHHLETARLSELLAKMMGLPQQRVEQVRVASLLHDVGTLSISPELLNKRDLYTNEERQLVNQHPTLGAELLRPIRALREICDILEHHHERWDGTGFPRGLKGESIPLPARIISLVDSYHAMISDRPYRKAMTEAEAIDVLKTGAGSQWDPFLVDIFITVLANSADNKPSTQNQQSTSTSSP